MTMKKIEKWICAIRDEIDSAMEYAEKYICYKTSNPAWSRMYADMAEDEANHADNLMKMAEEYISGLSWTAETDKECWEKCKRKVAEKSALVKLMLSK